MADNINKNSIGKSTQSKNHRKTNEHNRRPRQPRKPERGENVLYVCSKTNIKAQLERCNKLINNNEKEIIIHCLGAAIQRGILLALQICDGNITYQIHTNTLTTELLDDLEPAVDDADYEIQRRFNSALRIRIFKQDPLEKQD
ncbi:ribonuclease P protein subunit p20 isoform X1 [Leptinotarsa decemlineata]|uniref:ribonuclease P protein subunit p20 isoform X1 n=1 Tax=Leptinotarsa decemlineata TaxID=7539 RepID=UPI000C25491D|nr:ribonuclease P protein subunit p20-like isoform X1 [Leptinotarsa decemlineata]